MENASDMKWKIKSLFYTFTPKDPYPEITEYQALKAQHQKVKSFFRKDLPLPEPTSVSVHRAWVDGFEFAKSLVMQELDR